MRNSIRTRLTIAFVALTAGILLAVGVVLALRSYIAEQQQALALQTEFAQRVSTQVTSYIQGQENQLQLLIRIQGLNDLDVKQQTTLLSNLISYSDGFDKLTLLSVSGQERVVVSRTEANGQLADLSNADEFKIPMNRLELGLSESISPTSEKEQGGWSFLRSLLRVPTCEGSSKNRVAGLMQNYCIINLA